MFEFHINVFQSVTELKDLWCSMASNLPLEQYVHMLSVANMRIKELNSILENVCIVEFDTLFAL